MRLSRQYIGEGMQLNSIICNECDTIVSLPDRLSSREKLVCPCCHKTITRGSTKPKQLGAALASTCLILLIISNFFPFLAFEAQGPSQSISLLQTAFELNRQEYSLMAVLVFLFIFLLPMLYIITLLVFLFLTSINVASSLCLEMAKWISHLLPWCMADVFFTGVLVALIKIVALADIVFGMAFYSYLLFALMFLYLTQVVDVHRLWSWYEQAFEVNNG